MSNVEPLANLTLALSVLAATRQKINSSNDELIDFIVKHGRNIEFLYHHLAGPFHILTNGVIRKGHESGLPDISEWICYLDRLEYTMGIGELVVLFDQFQFDEAKFKQIFSREANAWVGFHHKTYPEFIQIVRYDNEYLVINSEMLESIRTLAELSGKKEASK